MFGLSLVGKTKIMKDDKCNGWACSECCGGTLKWGDICSICGEHASNQCENCPEEDKIQCEEIE
jgi:hypothetical protein